MDNFQHELLDTERLLLLLLLLLGYALFFTKAYP